MATLNGGRGWASDACAASVHRLDSAFGRILPIASAGRTYAEQQQAYYRYKYQGGPLALPPGTSIHEKGNAIDWGNAVYDLLGLRRGLGNQGTTLNSHGHRRTVSSEVWHTEYDANADQHRGGGGASGGPQIIHVQQWLNQNRGAGLVEDGIDGPATQAAVRAYQAVLGVTQDGVWGPGTEAAHVKYQASKNYAAPVRDIQELANKLGANLAVDGDYGPATAGWVRAFQGDHGLGVDGVVGPITWAKMQEVYAGAQNPYNQYGGAPWIKAIQNKLNRLGYGPLDEDGQDGPKTQAAVKKFQSDNGLGADGIAGPITNNKLDDKLTAAPVGRNASNRSTYDVQKKLIEKGYDLGQYGADGDYGAATTSAVIKFQRDNGLEPDGIYGAMTDEKLFAGAAPTTPTPSTGDWPTNGRNATTRPTKDIQAKVGMPASEQDGQYGPKTSVAVAQWQKANGLDADGVWGPASDLKGFPGVPLPDAPKAPDADPTYGKKIPLYPGAIWADVSPNKSVREGKIQLFVVHHIAAAGTTNESNRKRFMTANDRNVSPNWYVQADGGVSEIVPPDDYRAWTGGAIDHQAVTVETQNTSGEPNWSISEKSHEAIAQLVAWSAHRYQFPIQRGVAALSADGKTNVVITPGVLGHRDTPAGKSTGTLCPGPSMNIDWIINRAREIFQEKYQPGTTPETPQEPAEPSIPAGMSLVPTDFLKNLQANAQADADEIGKFLG